MLEEVTSAICAIIVALVWLKPAAFRILVDKDSGEPSLGRQGQFTALVVSTWGFAAQVIDKNLTEFYLTAYMGVWCAAQAASLLAKIKGGAQGGTTETVKVETKTVTPGATP